MKTRFVSCLDLQHRHSQAVPSATSKIKALRRFVPPPWLVLGAVAVLLLQLGRRARPRRGAPADPAHELEQEDRAPDGTSLEHYAG